MPNDPLKTLSTERPLWARVPVIVRLFGIGQSSVYNLIADGKIKTCSVPVRGRAGKTRVVSIASVEEYLEKSATGGH